MNTTKKDPVCGMQIEKSEAAGQIEYAGQTIYFCSSACLEKFEAKPTQFNTNEDQVIKKSNKTPLMLVLAVVVLLFLLFGGGAMNNSMMNGGMMGQRWSGGFNWMWIPSFLTLGFGILLGWMIFGQKRGNRP